MAATDGALFDSSYLRAHVTVHGRDDADVALAPGSAQEPRLALDQPQRQQDNGGARYRRRTREQRRRPELQQVRPNALGAPLHDVIQDLAEVEQDAAPSTVQRRHRECLEQWREHRQCGVCAGSRGHNDTRPRQHLELASGPLKHDWCGCSSIARSYLPRHLWEPLRLHVRALCGHVLWR